jgi:hypothetical protein
VVTALDEITQPVSTPYRFGLFSAATVLDDPGFSPRGGEYTWRVQGCTPGAQWDYCWTDEAAGQQQKNYPQDGWLTQGPFVAYDGVRCTRVGFPDGEQVARQRLALSEQGQAERRLWAQLATGATAVGADAVLYDATTPADDLTVAIGALEAQLAATTGAIGVIHAPRAAAIHWDKYGELIRDGNVLRTPLGTPIVFGGGYGYTGPDGTATDDVAWVYATGPTVVRRGTVIYHGGDREGFSRPSNEVQHLVERPYLITTDCPLFAAAFAMPGRPATVWPEVPAPLAMTVDDTDPTAVVATFTNAVCDTVAIAWGDGTTTHATVTDGAATATHNYETATTTAAVVEDTPATGKTRTKKGR